jgi:hypothetical protein
MTSNNIGSLDPGFPIRWQSFGGMLLFAAIAKFDEASRLTHRAMPSAMLLIEFEPTFLTARYRHAITPLVSARKNFGRLQL